MQVEPDTQPHWTWVGLKIAFLGTLFLVFVAALYLLFAGERIATRRAASGFVLLPMFSLFYLVRFSKIRYCAWSVLAHLGSIASIALIGICIALHQFDPPIIDTLSRPVLMLICGAILVFAVSIGGVAHFAGYGNSKRKRQSRDLRPPSV